MSEAVESTMSAVELLSTGRRHLAVKDYSSAAGTLSKACELLAQEHGELGDQCAEAYLWYGKALLGLSREESGVLGDGMPGAANADEEDDNDDENEENETADNGEAEEQTAGEDKTDDKTEPETNGEVKQSEAESTTSPEEPSSSADVDPDKPGPSNGEANDESAVDLEAEDDVDNLQLAWEMLDSARNIIEKRVAAGAGAGAGAGQGARALLAEVHLTLGEVALESETYDKAGADMLACLEIQKELYRSDDRRIAETHYQIGLANSLASNFEDAITHFKNAANILESRIKTLENPTAASEDATVKKYTSSDPGYTVEGEIKELKELLPEIREKIQDMMDYKAETIKRVRETLCGANGDSISSSNGAGSSAAPAKPAAAASDISHLIKRKRKASDSEDASAAKRSNT